MPSAASTAPASPKAGWMAGGGPAARGEEPGSAEAIQAGAASASRPAKRIRVSTPTAYTTAATARPALNPPQRARATVPTEPSTEKPPLIPQAQGRKEGDDLSTIR